MQDALNALGAENSKQNLLGISLDQELDQLSKKKRELEDLRLEYAAEYEKKQFMLHEMERQVDEVFKEHELAKEQLSFQKSERVRLSTAIRKNVHEVLLSNPDQKGARFGS